MRFTAPRFLSGIGENVQDAVDDLLALGVPSENIQSATLPHPCVLLLKLFPSAAKETVSETVSETGLGPCNSETGLGPCNSEGAKGALENGSSYPLENRSKKGLRNGTKY